jgi:multisubunit Na+/H+ antiporter MnhG subunit
MNDYFAFLILFIGCFMLIISAIAFFRAKDIFVMMQPFKIIGLFSLPLILLALTIERFSAKELSSAIALIIIEIIAALFFSHYFIQKSLENNTIPDGKVIDLTKKKRKKKKATDQSKHEG